MKLKRMQMGQPGAHTCFSCSLPHLHNNASLAHAKKPGVTLDQGSPTPRLRFKMYPKVSLSSFLTPAPAASLTLLPEGSSHLGSLSYFLTPAARTSLLKTKSDYSSLLLRASRDVHLTPKKTLQGPARSDSHGPSTCSLWPPMSPPH